MPSRSAHQVRRLRPDIVFGADIIAGFPTETEEMFARSLELVDACGLTHLHVFPFSARAGTPAARMPQVRREIVKERARRLRAKGEAALRRHLDGEIGACRQRAGRAADTSAAPSISRRCVSPRRSRRARSSRSPSQATTVANCRRRECSARGPARCDRGHHSDPPNRPARQHRGADGAPAPIL